MLVLNMKALEGRMGPITNLCNGKSRFTNGKAHNHCMECKIFGSSVSETTETVTVRNAVRTIEVILIAMKVAMVKIQCITNSSPRTIIVCPIICLR